MIYRSLAFKNSIVHLLLLVVGIGLVGFLVMKGSADKIIDASGKKLVHVSDLINLKFSESITNLERDIRHIGNSPFLQEFLSTGDEDIKHQLELEYASILASHPSFSQIRFISTEREGEELIRADRHEGSIVIIPDAGLQNKSSRDYYQQAVRLPKDSVYVSAINLNREHGQISVPYVPTIRVAYPVFQSGQLKGIMVINNDLRPLYNDLKTLLGDDMQLRIVNQEGHYLYHDDFEASFTFEFDRPALFNSNYGQAPASFFSNHPEVFSHENELSYISRLDPFRSSYDLYTVVSEDEGLILGSYYTWIRMSVSTIWILAIAFALISFFYMHRQSRELQAITGKLKLFPHQLDRQIELPVSRKDEIGELAKSFVDMSNVIKDNIASLENARKKAIEAVNDKTEFIENMSHEIRNPLQSISGLVEIMEKNNPEPHQLKIIESLKFNTSTLHSLVTDFLDYKNIIRGEISRDESWTDLIKVLQHVYGSHHYFAVSRNITFTLKTDPALKDLEIMVDNTRLNQILHNLVMNAIKYTSAGGHVVLSTQLMDKNKNEATVAFHIRDSGSGLDAEAIKQIKERYYTQEDSHKYTDSFGLGLSIVIQLLKTLNSQLNIDSEPDQGSDFSFDLALKAKDRPRPETRVQMASQSSDLSIDRMLIIEDDDQIISLYAHIFEPITDHFDICKNPDDLGQFHSHYNIVLSDLQIADKSMMAYTEHLVKYQTSGAIIYVVSASAKGIETLRQQIEDVHFIQKPFSIDGLKSRIKDHQSAKRFGVPNFNSLKADYDQDLQKIRNALALLNSEWSAILVALPDTIKRKDQEAFDQIVHKIITTIRRLDLKKFEQMLDALSVNLNNNEDALDSTEVTDALSFYLSQIRKELEISI